MKKIICSLLVIIAISFFCENRTKGFRFSQILSDLPSRPEWEIPLPPEQELKSLLCLLHQTFTYLGAGEQSVAFLGEDGKTVLKFFKHEEKWKKFVKNNTLKISYLKNAFPMFYRDFNPDPLFKSCVIAYEDLKEETGLLHLHLNKSNNLWGTAILHDAIGVEHRIDLDKTEFIVQEYAELVFSKIDREMKQGKTQEAQESLQAVFDSIESYCKKGVRVDNPAIQRNVGFKGNKVILLDIGSFQKSDNFRTTDALYKEMMGVTRRLERWLIKHHPSLLPAFTEKRIQKIKSKDFFIENSQEL